jgi:uncharacterized protein with von Willebrand factor type A (vWA) domain
VPDRGTSGADGTAFTGVLVNFVRELRGAGLPAGTGDAAAYCAAMTALDPADLVDLYWAGRTTLVSRREAIATYDEVFRRYFLDAGGPAAELLTLNARLTTENEAVLNIPATDPAAEEGHEEEAVLG